MHDCLYRIHYVTVVPCLFMMTFVAIILVFQACSSAGEPYFTTSVPELAAKTLHRQKEMEIAAHLQASTSAHTPASGHTGKEPVVLAVTREVSCLDYLFCSSSSVRVASVLSMVCYLHDCSSYESCF